MLSWQLPRVRTASGAELLTSSVKSGPGGGFVPSGFHAAEESLHDRTRSTRKLEIVARSGVPKIATVIAGLSGDQPPTPSPWRVGIAAALALVSGLGADR